MQDWYSRKTLDRDLRVRYYDTVAWEPTVAEQSVTEIAKYKMKLEETMKKLEGLEQKAEMVRIAETMKKLEELEKKAAEMARAEESARMLQ